MITVYTANSIYKLDPANMTVVRSNSIHEMRKDEEPVPMSFFAIGEIGEPLVMAIEVRDDGVGTIRTTSAITKIEHDE
jgi:hypothetical protein